MDSELSTAEAVAVINDKIVAVESLSDVKAKVGNKNFVIDNRFKDQVTVPGLIDQHIYPLLSALTMTSEIIAM